MRAAGKRFAISPPSTGRRVALPAEAARPANQAMTHIIAQQGGSVPTISGTEFPKPKNWQDFESMVRDALAQKWTSPNLQKNGRAGQKQHGVDIFGPDEIGRSVGVQCKRYKQMPDIKLVTEEVENAEKFGPLNTLWIGTTADHDAPLQAAVPVGNRMWSRRRPLCASTGRSGVLLTIRERPYVHVQSAARSSGQTRGAGDGCRIEESRRGGSAAILPGPANSDH